MRVYVRFIQYSLFTGFRPLDELIYQLEMDFSLRDEWNMTFSKDFDAKQLAQRKFANMGRYNLGALAS